jgi:hypothetical protein
MNGKVIVIVTVSHSSFTRETARTYLFERIYLLLKIGNHTGASRLFNFNSPIKNVSVFKLNSPQHFDRLGDVFLQQESVENSVSTS